MSLAQTVQDGDGPLNAVLQAIATARRRRLVRAVQGRDGKSKLGDIVDAVAGEEFGLDYSRQERKRVYVSIYQTHAPVLDDLGVVEFDRQDELRECATIAPTSVADDVAAFMGDMEATADMLALGGDAER